MAEQAAPYGTCKTKIDNALVMELTKHRGPGRLLRDTECVGFFVRVSSSGRVAFGVAYSFLGRERRMSLGTYPALSVQAARKLAHRRQAEAMLDVDPLAQRRLARRANLAAARAPTLTDLRDHHFEFHINATRANGEPIRTSQGVKSEGRYWRDILNLLGPDLRVTDLTRAKIEKMHRELSARAPVNANRVFASLRCALGQAVKVGWIERNPAVGVEQNQEQPRERYLNDEEIARLRHAVHSYPDRVSALFIWFALLTGARRGEILKARWPDIDLKAGVWIKPRATTKQRRMHRLPLSPHAVEALRELRTLRPSLDLVIPGNPETVLTALRRAWKAIRRNAGLDDVHFHDLRHAHATILISQGFSLEVIGAALGHSQFETTLRYAHLQDFTLRRAVGAVADIANGTAHSEGAIEV